MPVYRKDEHLGHDVPMVETDDITNHSVTEEKMADDSVQTRAIQDDAVTEPKLDNDAVSDRTIQDGAVSSQKIKDGAITPKKINKRVTEEVIEPLLKPLKEKDTDLQNQIDSFNEHGVSVSNNFGSNPHISVSQKTLTAAFHKVWQKFSEITGDVLEGIKLTVSPEYYIGEDGCALHISARTAEANGIFEKLAFYANGQLIVEAENVDYFEYDTTINETTAIECHAQIMGIEHSDMKLITHYSSFWLGASTNYANIMDVEHIIPVAHHMRGAYSIDVNSGDHIYIVIGETLAQEFIRADINGIEIQLNESTVAIDGVNYKVFESVNTYQAGTINVDING